MLLRALFLFLSLQLCASIDTITPTNPLKDGDVLTSKAGKFSLGFFSPGNSTNRYIGIWYTKVGMQTVVWVANRDNPINDSHGILSISRIGLLTLTSRKTFIWSSNVSDSVTRINSNNSSISCQLLDSGNLVLTTGTGKNFLWQSFDHITDTFLPVMKLGLDKKAGLNRYLTSWKSKDDPSPGNYLYQVDPKGLPQFFLYQGSNPLWRTGPWLVNKWSGVPEMAHVYLLNATFINNLNEISIIDNVLDDNVITIMSVDGYSGKVQRRTWHEDSKRWMDFWLAPKDLCDQYGECGPFGICNGNNAKQYECTCFPGYKPKSPRHWFLRDASQGCVREENRSLCRSGKGFLKLASVKMPDTSNARVNMSLTSKECEKECLKNCSCIGYTSEDGSGGGSGCISFYGQLMDTKIFLNGDQNLYFRADAVTIAKSQKSKGLFANKKLEVVLITVVLLAFTLLIFFLLFLLHKKKKKEWEEEAERALWTNDADADASSDLPFL